MVADVLLPGGENKLPGGEKKGGRGSRGSRGLINRNNHHSLGLFLKVKYVDIASDDGHIFETLLLGNTVNVDLLRFRI